MVDTTPTGEQSDTDRVPTVPVAEAARILNVTPDAIRARLRRGTLLGGKRGSEWFVQLPADAAEQDTSRDNDTTQQDATDRRPDALLEQLRSENEHLRDQLSHTIRQLAAERERADVLHREALGRIEALTATVGERPGQQDATGPRSEAVESPQRAARCQGVATSTPGRIAACALDTAPPRHTSRSPCPAASGRSTREATPSPASPGIASPPKTPGTSDRRARRTQTQAAA